jgi:multisubunit Na+/H+ antiporter MnhB subunit
MILLGIFLLALSIFEIHSIWGNKRDAAVYIVLVIIGYILGMLYISNPYGNSISYYIFKYLNISY